MKLRVIFITLLLNIKFSFEENVQIEMFSDYGLNLNTDKSDLRQRFLYRKRKNYNEDMKVKLFNKINSNKTLFVAGVLHLLDDDYLKNKMENSFRNVLRMNGSKYIFKRDFYWRTWREVKNESGYSSIICYKCQSTVNKTCEKCNTGGYWDIEERPPNCPYEIFSMKSEQEVCIINYTQYFKPLIACPSVISVRDLIISCGNPIETKWRITKLYNIPERSVTVICQGRENCEILTLYMMLPDSIIFSIINSTNHVFYSRVMKSLNKNYICTNDCGIYNPLSKGITKQEGPLVVNLLENNKNKREYKHSKQWPDRLNKNKLNMVMNKMELQKNSLHYREQKHKGKNAKKLIINNAPMLQKHNELITKAHCKRLQEKYLEDYEDESYYYDYS